MKKYYRIVLGTKSAFAEQCFSEGFVGVIFDFQEDLTGSLPEEWRLFNRKYVPVYLAGHPGTTKIGAGLACGATWTVCKGIKIGDIVISPDGKGCYRVGEVIGDYRYAPGSVLPHQRPVRWEMRPIDRNEMSDALKRYISIGTVVVVVEHGEEIERLLGREAPAVIVSTDPEVEDPSAFAMEKHLEDFLVKNWTMTDLGKEYDVFEEKGERVGQQFSTDTGPIDILAVRKDKKELLVIELKKGRASDVVVGQILRYMGFVQDELAEPGQSVRGIIIALEDDQRLRRALSVVPNVTFFRYQVSFKLVQT